MRVCCMYVVEGMLWRVCALFGRGAHIGAALSVHTSL